MQLYHTQQAKLINLIKFWLAVDVDTKYIVNRAPYLVKDETQRPGQPLGHSVVLKMVEELQKHHH